MIEEHTGKSKIAFIGHSTGATTMLTSLTLEQAQWFKDRISVFVALAPISRMDHMKSTLLRILGVSDIPIKIVQLLGIHEWFNENIIATTLFQHVCNYLPQICEFNFKLISEGDPSVNNRDALRIYLGHFPGGLSVKLLAHELQMYRAAKFQKYDYGTEENMKKYGTKQPPEYDLSKISGIPVAMMVGTSDLLGDVEDNRWLRDQLEDNVMFYKEYNYGGTSFYIAKDMGYLEEVTSILSQYTNVSSRKGVKGNLKKESA